MMEAVWQERLGVSCRGLHEPVRLLLGLGRSHQQHPVVHDFAGFFLIAPRTHAQ